MAGCSLDSLLRQGDTLAGRGAWGLARGRSPCPRLNLGSGGSTLVPDLGQPFRGGGRCQPTGPSGNWPRRSTLSRISATSEVATRGCLPTNAATLLWQIGSGPRSNRANKAGALPCVERIRGQPHFARGRRGKVEQCHLPKRPFAERHDRGSIRCAQLPWRCATGRAPCSSAAMPWGASFTTEAAPHVGNLDRGHVDNSLILEPQEAPLFMRMRKSPEGV